MLAAMSFKDAFRFDYDYIHQRIGEIAGRFDEDSAFSRPSPDMNHAAWLLGHITWCEDSLVAEVPYGRTFRNKDWDQLFDFHSKKLNRESYPAYAEIRSHYDRVHVEILKLLEGVSDDGLQELVPYGDAKHSRMAFFVHFIEEGSTHVGQLQYLHKILKGRANQ